MESYAKLNASCSSMFSGATTSKTPPLINHASTIHSMSHKSGDLARQALEQLNELRKSGQLCDVTLIAKLNTTDGADSETLDGGGIQAHRLVLAACSSYFKAMFTSEMAESKLEEIELLGINDSTLQTLVDFCYTGEIIVNDSNVQSILPAANLLQIQEVQDVCCEFLKKQLHFSNCLGIKKFAELHCCRDLCKAAEKYMLDNFQDVLTTEEFILLPSDQLIEVIAHNELNVKSEEQVFEGVMTWIHYDELNRQAYLAKVLENVRLSLFNPKYLVNTVSEEPLIKKDMACRDLVDEAKNFLLLPAERADRQGVRSKPRQPTKYGALLYAVGGWCSGDALASVERMDARTGEWRTVAPMNKRRCGVGVAVLNDLLYAVGGHDGQRYLKCVERYDPRTNQWSSDVAPTSTCRTSVGVAVYDQYLYAVGGQDGVSCLNIVERYDPIRNEWKIVAPMNSSRLGVSVSVLDGCLYAVGGADHKSPLNTVERYDPRTDKWYMVRQMSARRKHLGTAVYNGFLYAVGGRAESCELNSAEKYDPVKNEWISVSSMMSRRSGVGLAVVNDQLYAIGGFDGQAYLKTVEIYEEDVGMSNSRNQELNQWRHAGSMSYRRLGGGVGVICLTNEVLAACTAYGTDSTCSMDGGGSACLLEMGYDMSFP
ncbi:kelch motif domain-containing protein [Ditylenchus destructor]|nr:kelch motif domain-containing protein [Ditylenchus destructor]